MASSMFSATSVWRSVVALSLMAQLRDSSMAVRMATNAFHCLQFRQQRFHVVAGIAKGSPVNHTSDGCGVKKYNLHWTMAQADWHSPEILIPIT
jgi:hypothetical protein